MFYLFLVVVLIIVINFIITVIITNRAHQKMFAVIDAQKQEFDEQRESMCSRIKTLEEDLSAAIEWMKSVVVILEEKNIHYPSIPDGIEIPIQTQNNNRIYNL